MNRAGVFNLLLIALQLAMFFVWQVGMLGRTATAGILLLSLIPLARLHLSQTVHTGLLVLSAVAFAMESFTQLSLRGVYGLFALLSEFLLFVQALELIRDQRTTTANYVPGLSVLTFSMLLMASEESIGLQTLGYLCIAFVILIVLVMRPDLPLLLISDRRGRHKAQLLLVIFCTAILSGWLFEAELNRNLPLLRQLIGTFSFSGNDFAESAVSLQKARLVDRAGLGGSVGLQAENLNDLVFVVRSKEAPGYMRTIAFSDFDGLQWSNSWSEVQRRGSPFIRLVESTNQIPDVVDGLKELTSGVRLFDLTGDTKKELQKYIVEIPGGRGKLIPLTSNANYVFGVPTSRRPQILVDAHGGVLRGTLENQSFGILAGGANAGQPPTLYLRQLLSVPRSDSQFLRELADQICKGKPSTSEKLVAVQDYFQANFSYSIDPKLNADSGDRSPLRAFLVESRKAHCEYFATATALLLRTQGIPCRMAVGYLVYEQSDETGDFAAQNRNAHAWVEAYDEVDQSWKIVESTPSIAEYIASHSSSSSELAKQNSDSAASDDQNQFSFLLLIDAIALAITQWWSWLISSRFAWTLPLLLALIFIWIRYRSHALRAGQLTSVSLAVRKADRLARKFGVERGAGETCLQFATRLEQMQPELKPLADWYCLFSSFRYRENEFAAPRLPRIAQAHVGNRRSTESLPTQSDASSPQASSS